MPPKKKPKMTSEPLKKTVDKSPSEPSRGALKRGLHHYVDKRTDKDSIILTATVEKMGSMVYGFGGLEWRFSTGRFSDGTPDHTNYLSVQLELLPASNKDLHNDYTIKIKGRIVLEVKKQEIERMDDNDDGVAKPEVFKEIFRPSKKRFVVKQFVPISTISGRDSIYLERKDGPQKLSFTIRLELEFIDLATSITFNFNKRGKGLNFQDNNLKLCIRNSVLNVDKRRLASNSEFFRNWLAENPTTDKFELKKDADFDPGAFKSWLHLIFSPLKQVLDPKNVEAVLEISHYLGSVSGKDYCERFLIDNCKSHKIKCHKKLELADEHDLLNLKTKIMRRLISRESIEKTLQKPEKIAKSTVDMLRRKLKDAPKLDDLRKKKKKREPKKKSKPSRFRTKKAPVSVK